MVAGKANGPTSGAVGQHLERFNQEYETRLAKGNPLGDKAPADTEFVKLGVRLPWFMKAIGYNSRALPSTRSDLLEQLRSKIKVAWKHGVALSRLSNRGPIQGRRTGVCNDGISTKSKSVVGYRFEMRMPEKCKEEDATCESYRNVRLFLVDSKQVWVHKEDVPWVVRYMFVQHYLRKAPVWDQDGKFLDAPVRHQGVHKRPAAAMSSTVGNDSHTVLV